MNASIHDWLLHSRPPEDLYELLGKARFDPDREGLLAAIRAAYAELLPCQNHEDRRIAERAMDLQRELGRAADILSDRVKLHEHHESILRRLREASTRMQQQSAASWNVARCEAWLREEGRVHPRRAGEVARYLLASSDETVALDLGSRDDYPLASEYPLAGEKVEGYVLQDEPPQAPPPPHLGGPPAPSEPLAEVEVIPEDAVTPDAKYEWPRMYGIKEPKRPRTRDRDPSKEAAFRRQRRQAEFVLWMIAFGVGWLVVAILVLANLR